MGKSIQELVHGTMEILQEHAGNDSEDCMSALAKQQSKEKFDAAVESGKFRPLHLVLENGSIRGVDVNSRAMASARTRIEWYFHVPHALSPLSNVSIFLPGCNALCPSLGVIPTGNPSKLSFDEAKVQRKVNHPWPTVVCEVAELQSLLRLHAAAEVYFGAPGSEVEYYWVIKRYVGSDAMLSLLYTKGQLQPVACSFGLSPLPADTLELLQRMDCASTRGVGFGDAPCDRLGLAAYEVVFDMAKIWWGCAGQTAPETLPSQVRIDMFAIQQAFFGELSFPG